MNNLLNEIKNLSNEVESISTKVEDMDIKIKDAEMKQIDEILKACKGGFKFNKIVSDKTTWNNYNEMREDEVDYFFEKGVFLNKQIIHKSKEHYGEKIISYELWLIQNGVLEVYKCTEKNSVYQDDYSILERCYIDNKVLEYFETEDIIEGIKGALERRMKSLTNRTKAQEERIKKLEKYM